MSSTTEQQTRHIYLTSGCCENTDHVGRRALLDLGLGYGWWTGRDVITAKGMEDKPKPEYDFYPLTAEESLFINEHGFTTGEGYVGLTGYSTLYQGKKWLTPTVEVEWHTEDKARHGYKAEDMHAPTQDEALVIARRLAARATHRLERIGGYAEIEETYETADDRWTVALHIPMEWALNNLKSHRGFDFDRYCGFLTGLMV